MGSFCNGAILYQILLKSNWNAIKYYYNPIKRNFGICDCEKPCNGKGKDNTCKKITIAVFKSGKIIITGGRNKQNINSAYQFITEFINENKDKILIK